MEAEGSEVSGGASIASCAVGARGGLGVSCRALFGGCLLDCELDAGCVEGSPSFSKIGKKRFLFLFGIVEWKRAGIFILLRCCNHFYFFILTELGVGIIVANVVVFLWRGARGVGLVRRD
jgi:hypothetical protein